MNEPTTCGDRLDPSPVPSPVLAHIVCDRAVNANGKHTGKHIWHDPETGRPRISWWATPAGTMVGGAA